MSEVVGVEHQSGTRTECQEFSQKNVPVDMFDIPGIERYASREGSSATIVLNTVE